MAFIVIDNRIRCIADCVRNGAVLADIGTDHGKLPIYLAQTQKIKHAVAVDINEMPLLKAKNNIKKYGLDLVIDTYLTDGLRGVEVFCPTDIVIAGMGGELIEDILNKQTTDRKNVRYILQPMTKEECLRKFLCNNGYSIFDEYIVKEQRLYQVICAEYTGKNTEMSAAEYILGRKNIEKNDICFRELLEKTIEKTIRIMHGRQTAYLDIKCEEDLIHELITIREKYYGER